MKKLFDAKLLPILPLSAGILGLLLRFWLYATGIDEKGLLVTGHPLMPISFLLTAAVLAALLLCCRNIPKNSDFPESPVAALGCAAAAIGILLTNTLELIIRQDTITIVCFALGIAAAICMLIATACHIKGNRPSFIVFGILTVYLMLHPLSQYRLWSADPQLMNYCFHLLASVFLMLTGYHRTALDAGKGNAKWYTFCSQAALFFCCISIHGDSWLFYLSMALWTAAGLCKPSKQELPAGEEA